jgi:hypothetical protein
MANEIATVNATTGELEETESRPVSQLVNTLNPKTFEERKAVFNAVNNAQSLDDMKDKPIKITGVAQVHSVRIDRNTGEEVPCIGTTLVGADGTGYYSQSAGIARSAYNLVAAFGANWPEPLTVHVKATTLASKNTLKTLVLD